MLGAPIKTTLYIYFTSSSKRQPAHNKAANPLPGKRMCMEMAIKAIMFSARNLEGHPGISHRSHEHYAFKDNLFWTTYSSRTTHPNTNRYCSPSSKSAITFFSSSTAHLDDSLLLYDMSYNSTLWFSTTTNFFDRHHTSRGVCWLACSLVSHTLIPSKGSSADPFVDHCTLIPSRVC
jgi:hypothetical protein